MAGQRCIIAVACRKGGVGKTAVAVGLASIAAAKGRRVLLVDLDPQSSTAFVLGGDPAIPGTAPLLERHPVEPQRVGQDIQVLAGGPDLAEGRISRIESVELGQRLRELPFDTIICDCPPGHEHLERFALRAADVALVPLNAHPQAVTGAQRVLSDLAEDAELHRPVPTRQAVLLTHYDGRRSLDRLGTGLLEERWRLLPTFTVRYDSDYAKALALGQPVMTSIPKSRAVEDLTRVWEWIDGR